MCIFVCAGIHMYVYRHLYTCMSAVARESLELAEQARLAYSGYRTSLWCGGHSTPKDFKESHSDHQDLRSGSTMPK